MNILLPCLLYWRQHIQQAFQLLFKQTIAGRDKLTITLNTLFHNVEELLQKPNINQRKRKWSSSSQTDANSANLHYAGKPRNCDYIYTHIYVCAQHTYIKDIENSLRLQSFKETKSDKMSRLFPKKRIPKPKKIQLYRSFVYFCVLH